jgi:hypothetical protein
MSRFIIPSLKIFAVLTMAALSACQKTPAPAESRAKWGFVNGGQYANLLNLEPNQSVSICSPDADWSAAARFAIEQWATVLGRWGYFKVLNCGDSADLTINMQGFDSVGLNYFRASPGRIFLQSSASGDYLKALALHEYGHSFGMCDQYPSVNNCTQLSSQKNDQEVMGTTYEAKIRLTQGDIEGVKSVADSPEVPTNEIWKKFLSSKPGQITPGDAEPVKVLVADSSDVNAPLLKISVEAGSTVTLCLDSSDVSCAPNSRNELPLTKDLPINGRDIYKAQTTAAMFASASKAVFVAKIKSGTLSQSPKFAVVRK